MRARSRLLTVLAAAVAALACAAPVAGADIILPPPGVCLGPRVLSIDDHRGVEGTKAPGATPTAFTFPITSTGCATAASVYFTTVPSGRAKLGPDLTSANGIVRFPQGDLSTRTITIAVRPDNLGEVTETFGVILCPDTGFLSLKRGSASGWILNDDPAPLISDPDEHPNFHCSE